jgi:chromosome segregation ATPase
MEDLQIAERQSAEIEGAIEGVMVRRDSLSEVVGYAREAATISATLEAHYHDAALDGISTRLLGDKSIVARFIYVLSEYRRALAAKEDEVVRAVEAGAAASSRHAEIMKEYEAAIAVEHDHVQKLADERDSLQEQLALADKARNDVIRERDEQSRIRAELQLKYDNGLDELHVKIANLEAGLALTEQQRDAAVKDFEDLVGAIDQAKDDSRGADDALAAMTAARDQLADEVADQRTEIVSLEDDIDALKKKIAEPAGEVDHRKVIARANRYRLLVEAVGKKLLEVPPSVKAAYGAAIAR